MYAIFHIESPNLPVIERHECEISHKFLPIGGFAAFIGAARSASPSCGDVPAMQAAMQADILHLPNINKKTSDPSAGGLSLALFRDMR
ncbi:hypothetical protein [Cohnella fermenti]|uniref:Uncharacterized protein n=1 Tax=Cohnella fermenti TaxID=2565925 RepID=A0A4S4C2Z6_9BACL|nr:hypothetical protein [Cohnella fermenti]THF79944.1 hypothetical protein E6C55_11505 [Cohnella fermenti]